MYYNKDIPSVLKEFNTSVSGLSQNQAAENRRIFGENKLQEKKKKTTLQIFLEQFKDLLVIILIVAAAISMAAGNTESTAVILAVLVLNAILGTVQYIKAEKSLESLKSLSAPVAKVVRDGENLEISAASWPAATLSVWKPGISCPATDASWRATR